jgi:hypothetical protein
MTLLQMILLALPCPCEKLTVSLKENLHAEKVIVLVDACHSAAIGGASVGEVPLLIPPC